MDIRHTKACSKSVSDRTGFHWWPCAKPAKFHVSNTGGKDYLVCGIHAQRVRRLIEHGTSTAAIRPLSDDLVSPK